MESSGGVLMSRKRRGRKLTFLVAGGSIKYEIAHTMIKWNVMKSEGRVVLWKSFDDGSIKEVFPNGVQPIGFRRVDGRETGEGFAYNAWRYQILVKFGPLYFDSERGARLSWEIMQSQYRNMREAIAKNEAMLAAIETEYPAAREQWKSAGV